MIFGVLVGACAFAALAGAVLAAQDAGSGYILAGGIGLPLGACNAWIMSQVGAFVAHRTKTYSELNRERCVGAFYLVSLLVWLPLTAFIAIYLTTMAVTR